MKKKERMFELVDQWHKSGQTKTDFCQQKKINIHTFTYWVQKYKTQGQQKHKANNTKKFIPLQVAPGRPTAVELVYPNGVRLCVPEEVDLLFLKSLIKIEI